MQKVLLYTVGALFLALVLIGLALPRKAAVSVSTQIDAYPATVFALTNDFDRVALWSPRLDSDPDVRVTYEGPERGVGSTMLWDGPIIGTGRETITESRPLRYIEYAINPTEPGHARSWLDFGDDNGRTEVSWTHETDYGINLVARYFAPLLGGVVKRDLARGLAQLENLAESLPRVDFGDVVVEQLVVEAMPIAYLSTSSRVEPAAISEAMGAAYFEILNVIDAMGLEEDGPPLSITRSLSGTRLNFDAAIPVRGPNDREPTDSGNVKLGHTYAGPVIRVAHVGSYRTLGTTHRKISAYLTTLGMQRNGDAWEAYVSDPTRVPERELLTYVYYPIRP